MSISKNDSTHAPHVTELDHQAIDALLERVSEAQKHNLALSSEDYQLLIDALLMLAQVQTKLSAKDVTISKLRKLAGIVASSEKLKSNLAQQRGQRNGTSSTHTGSNQNQKKSQSAPTQPSVVHHKHEDLKKGDSCPECPIGKLYKVEPATFLRIVGQCPFHPEQHVRERLRCNACAAYFTAEMDQSSAQDGEQGQKYGFTARSVMALSKFGMGSPYYRQGELSQHLGVHVSASTIFDQVEYLSNDLHPVFEHLKKLAAQANLYFIDDTTHKILSAEPIEKKIRGSDKQRMRSGVYTSCLIAFLPEGQRLTFYETSIGHSGEFADEILHWRDSERAQPLVMSDALSSNQIYAREVLRCVCNAHARRKFHEIQASFPSETEWVLQQYYQIWEHERTLQASKSNEQQRLEFHAQHSWPVMESIRKWGEAQLEVDPQTDRAQCEANSTLGQAIRYFLNHYEGLTQFCKVLGAPIDNNLAEQQIKKVVLNRKNAYFYKTQAGASIGDVITSMLSICEHARVNAFDYFNHLQRNRGKIKENIEAYLPWNFVASSN